MDGCTDQEKDDILEAILAEAEEAFDYKSEVQKHLKFNCLNKYLCKYTLGKKDKTATQSEKVLESWMSNTKKLQLQNAPAGSSTGPELLQTEPSESFKALNESSKQLEVLRNKLLKDHEEFLLLLERVKTKDESWKGKITELEGAKTVLNKFLQDVRPMLAHRPPPTVEGDYTAQVAQTKEQIAAATSHLQATNLLLKQVKGLLEG